MGEYFKNIKKRNGQTAEFDKEKIAQAIFKAAQSVGGSDIEVSRKIADKVVFVLRIKFDSETDVPSVEQIQDIVEKVLVEEGHAKTAKAYILYREKHAQIREMKDTFLDVEKTINEYLHQDDWRVKENSNEAYSFSGLLLHTAGKVIASYALTKIYPKEVSDAYKQGYIHIHDLSHGFIGYCAGWSLKDLLVKGFGGVANKVDAKPAKHLDVVVHQMVNFIGCLQMEFAGAQAFSSVDTLLAPFIKTDNLAYKQTKQCMQELVYSLNIPSRWGSQYPFSNLTFDWTVPEDMENEKAIVGGKEQDFTYGECQKEMDMVNKAFLDIMKEGDANGRIFTFPIPTYNLTKDFNWDSDNSKLLFDVTAKYGIPYFQNYIGSDLDPKSIRAMCCRLNMDTSQLINRPGGMWGPGDATGSIGVITINLNRIGFEAKQTFEKSLSKNTLLEAKQEFFDKLSYYMNLAKDSLEIKRKIINKNLENNLMPYTKAYLGTFNNHFSTIGLIGMNEACVNFLGKNISSEEGKQFAIETLTFMRNKCFDFQKETKNLYNLEATPAESASYRLARLDKKHHPEIYTAGTDTPYLTNSTQLPVNHTEDAIEAIEHQNQIQHLYTGGTIFHTFLGERMSDGETCKQLVKKIAENTRLPYYSITPTFSVCPVHGYIKGEHFNCPNTVKEKINEEVIVNG